MSIKRFGEKRQGGNQMQPMQMQGQQQPIPMQGNFPNQSPPDGIMLPMPTEDYVLLTCLNGLLAAGTTIAKQKVMEEAMEYANLFMDECKKATE